MKRFLTRLERLQRRYPALSLPLAVFKRFGEHGGGRLATTVSYWSFFSIFPLLLAFVTVLNIVLKDNEDLRDDLVNGALGQVPVIGSQLADDQHALGGSWVTIAVGVGAALWTGLAAAKAYQVALDEIWDVPMYRRPNGAITRLKSLTFLLVLAAGIVVSTMSSNLAGFVDSGLVVQLAGFAMALVISGGTLLFSFWFLTTGPNPVKELLPGAIVGGVGLVILQVLGALVIKHWINGASDTYGTFAVVIALLSWFFLISRIALMSAELNAVLARHLFPRSMLPDGALTEGDRMAAELDIQRVQHDKRLDEDREAAEETVDPGAVITA